MAAAPAPKKPSYSLRPKQPKLSLKQPVPCPTCYRECRPVDGVWCCPTHGPRP